MLLTGGLTLSIRTDIQNHDKPKNGIKTAARDESGRFGPGNSGKLSGARHRATQAVEALLDGQAKTMGRKAVEHALEGDTTALRLCLERIAPPRKDTPFTSDLPKINSAGDVAEAAGATLQAVATGELTILDSAHVAVFTKSFVSANQVMVGVTDPLDNDWVTATFPTEGLEAAPEKLKCYPQ